MPVVHITVRNVDGKEIKVEINRSGGVCERLANPGRWSRPLRIADVVEEDRGKVEAARKLAMTKVIQNLTNKKLECITDERMVIDMPIYAEEIKRLCVFDEVPTQHDLNTAAVNIVKFIEISWLIQNTTNPTPDQKSDKFDLAAVKESIDNFVLDLPPCLLPAMKDAMAMRQMRLMIHDEKLGLIEV